MQKLSKIRSKMQEKGYSAVLLTDELNCYYATGLAFTDGCVLITDRSAHLITDSRYTEEASMRADPSFSVVVANDSFNNTMEDSVILSTI